MQFLKISPGINLYGFIWASTLVLIPLFSVFGRSMQHWLRSFVSPGQLAVLFLLTSLALMGLLVVSPTRRPRRTHWFHLVWAAALFLILPLALPTVEERLHFIIFGLMGFSSIGIFKLRRAVSIGMLVGGLDEVLQWLLPDRVGDWRDAVFNCVACLGGCLLSYFLETNHETIDRSP